MSHLMRGKQYGLVLPKAAGQKAATEETILRKKPSIFNQSDSDEEKSDGEDWVKKSMKGKTTNSSGLKKQTKIVMAKALEEDPTVFQYDEVYEKMEEKKVEEVEKKKEVDRQPKYIKNLLKSAEIRNKEFERRVERKVQKEREAEGEMFADKESFVTGAYRRKMEEMAKEEEEEQRKERIEAALDVTKQRDLSGFYRHLYRQTHGEERSELEDKIKKEEEEKIKKEKEGEEESLEDMARKVKEQMAKIKVEEEDEDEEEGGRQEQSTDLNIKKISKNKKFRQKNDESESSSSSDGDSDSESEREETLEIKKEELTAEEKIEKRKQEMKEQKERRQKRKRKIERDESSSESEVEEISDKKLKKNEKKKEEEAEEREVTEVGQDKEDTKSKVDIWKKRTVDHVFEEALTRYWQRVAERRG